MLRGGEGIVKNCQYVKTRGGAEGKKLLHCVKEEMSRWKEKEVRGVKRRRVFDENKQYCRGHGEEEEKGGDVTV